MTPGPPPPQGDPLTPHGLSPAELAEVLEAQRRGKACLVWRDRDGTLRTRAVEDDGQRSWTIGRGDGMDVVIADPQVSRVHARLERDADEWAVVDLGMSRNGTFVNGRRVLVRSRLADNDRMRLGQTLVAIKIRSATEAVPTVLADDGPATARVTASQHRVLVALCRPLVADPERGEPATNKEIAGELHIEVHTVKVHLSRVYATFALAGLKPHQKRRRLAAYALEAGVVTPADMAREA